MLHGKQVIQMPAEIHHRSPMQVVINDVIKGQQNDSGMRGQTDKRTDNAACRWMERKTDTPRRKRVDTYAGLTGRHTNRQPSEAVFSFRGISTCE